MFPREALHGFALPMLQDLFNHPFFTLFHQWTADHRVDVNTSHLTATAKVQPSLGLQTTVLAQKGALPSKVLPHQSKEALFRACCKASHEERLPFDDLACSADFSFAAWCAIHCLPVLRDHRKLGRDLLQELSRRCQPLSRHLRKFLHPSINSVAGHIHVGLIAALIILMKWPDRTLPLGFLQGFALIGQLETVSIWTAVDEVPDIDEATLCGTGPAVLQQYGRRHFDQDELQFLWASCQKEVANGKAGAPVTVESLDVEYGKDSWSVVPAFVHTQPDGKRRRIDDAKAGMQNLATAFSERFSMVSAMMPAVAARALGAWAAREGAVTMLQSTRLFTAAEDLPEAYRILPVHPRHLRHNNVAVQHPQTKEVHVFPCWALLFGFAASVFQFERFSFFLEAAGRRVLHLMVSLYVDDSHLDDLECAGGHGQALWKELATECGQSFKEAKAQDLALQNDFLGISHDTSAAFSSWTVSFHAKQSLVDKAVGLIRARMAAGRTTPAQASKIRGVCGFIALAQWGRVGRAPFGPLRRRQYSDKHPWDNSRELCRAYNLLLMLLEFHVPRTVKVTASALGFLVVASDAQADSNPSGGVLIYDPVTGHKVGGHLQFQQQLLEAWGYSPAALRAGANPIALCECCMLPITLMNFRNIFAGRDVLWLCDNTTALYSIVKGTARGPQLDCIVAVFHFLLYFLNVRCWLEWVGSNSNYSDGISRELDKDPFSTAHGFELRPMWCPQSLWFQPLRVMWKRCQQFEVSHV